MIDRDYVRRNPNLRRHRAELLAALLVILQYAAVGVASYGLGYLALLQSGGAQ